MIKSHSRDEHDTARQSDSAWPNAAGRVTADIDYTVGRRMYELRSQRGFSLEQCAKQLGVAAQALEKYEEGTDRVPGAIIVAFATLFNVKVAHIFGVG